MKKTMLLTAALALVAGPAFASGYRIPEQSINSVALSNAYVANTNGADTSYYNPARMSWLDNKWQSEFSLTYINLPSIEYTHNGAAANNSGSRDENFLIPTLHLVSPEYNNFRFGFSVTHPYGLSKRWDNALPKSTAEEFTLKVFEFNPTVSYKINDKLSVAAGARMLYTDGKVKSNAGALARDLAGDSTDFGYNLAISYLPSTNWSLAATYRSKINLTVEGDARLYLAGNKVYDGYAEVMVPAPAVLTLATAYTWNKTTFEFNYDKTYWSAYDKLDFNYAYALPGPFLGPAFDNPLAKNWVNTDAFRFGITHRCTKEWTAMAGFAIDRNPIPDNTLGFELPDSDAKLYSLGLRYQPNDRLTLGAAYLYDDKESRSVTNVSATAPNGTFSDAAAHLVTMGAQYTF